MRFVFDILHENNDYNRNGGRRSVVVFDTDRTRAGWELVAIHQNVILLLLLSSYT